MKDLIKAAKEKGFGKIPEDYGKGKLAFYIWMCLCELSI